MARLRLHALLLSFVALPLLAGCGGDDKKSEAAFNASDLKGFVMSPSDLPGGYKLVTEQASSSAQKCVGGKTSREQAVAATAARSKTPRVRPTGGARAGLLAGAPRAA